MGAAASRVGFDSRFMTWGLVCRRMIFCKTWGRCAAFSSCEGEETVLKFWICLTLGLLVYFLLGRSAVNEGLSIVLTIAVMAVAWVGFGWLIEGRPPLGKKAPPEDGSPADKG